MSSDLKTSIPGIVLHVGFGSAGHSSDGRELHLQFGRSRYESMAPEVLTAWGRRSFYFHLTQVYWFDQC